MFDELAWWIIYSAQLMYDFTYIVHYKYTFLVTLWHGNVIFLMNWFNEFCFTLAKNDVFVTIGLGKEKYQTSPKEKAIDNEFTEWHEVCEL